MKRREFLNGVVGTALGVSALRWANDGVSAAEEGANGAATASGKLPKNVVRRGEYRNSKRVFETTGRGRVAFLGGSITEMDGYRPMVCDYLTKKFPQTEFDFVAAGISSTCSDVGAFRLETDVLKNGPVDLFFVEFSVNDDQDGRFSVERAIRGMEGIIGRMRAENPNVDIVMTFFVNERLMADYRAGKVAPSIQAHSAVAERWAISTINLAKEIQERIDDKRLTWQEFGGVHPAPRGNKICADMIAALLDDAWSETCAESAESAEAGLTPHKTPTPLDEFSFMNAGFRGFDGVATNVGKIDDGASVKDGGFKLYVPDWTKIRGSFRGTFANLPLLCGEKVGAEFSFDFDGRSLALYVLAGPDAGRLDVKIDGGDWTQVEVFHDYSGGLHYPRAVALADGLKRGRHSVVCRIAAEKDARSAGNAVRILQICVAR